jgi:hypothetical protein
MYETEWFIREVADKKEFIVQEVLSNIIRYLLHVKAVLSQAP